MAKKKISGGALEARQSEIRHIDKRGEFVEADDVNAVYAVNLGDPDAHNFIESVKKAGSVGGGGREE